MSGSGGGRTGVRQVVEPAVAASGFDLEDVVVSSAGRRRLVRVVVDRDGGVGLDDVAEVNHAVSAALDDSDVLGDAPYVLEISSPGVDRPLREARHWRRAAGRLVSVTVAGTGPLTARVLAADEESVTFAGPGEEPRRIALADLGPGSVQVEFTRPASGPDHGAGDEAGGDEAGDDEVLGDDDEDADDEDGDDRALGDDDEADEADEAAGADAAGADPGEGRAR